MATENELKRGARVRTRAGAGTVVRGPACDVHGFKGRTIIVELDKGKWREPFLEDEWGVIVATS